MTLSLNLLPNILIVDDKEENLHAIKRVLATIPGKLHLCQSGQEALKLLVHHRFALAILDVQMPEMDGFELAELMSNNPDTDTIPIIFVTAINKDKLHVKHGYEVGSVDYICKPYDADILIAKVHVFLKLYQQRLIAIKLQSKQEFILNELTDGWWKWKIGSKNYYTSRKFKNTLGYEEHELKNDLATLHDLMDQEDLVLNNKLLEEHIKEDKLYQLPLRFHHKSGHIVWMLCRGTVVEDTDGTRNHMIGTYTDITLLKETEMKLKRSNEDLEQFAYIASHDLRAPLRGIQSLVTWIQEDEGSQFQGKTKEYFDKLIQRIQRMDSLIDGILTYSRIDSDAAKHISVDLNKLITIVIDSLQNPDKCKIEAQKNLPTIVADDTQIQQVFSNIIGNAIKYCDKDKVIIKITFEEKPFAYQINITDNGPGIEEEYFDKIFALFQTLQPRDKVESTGIGLTITKKIIQSSGGQIWVTSELGKGTTFHFTWPKNSTSINTSAIKELQDEC